MSKIEIFKGDDTGERIWCCRWNDDSNKTIGQGKKGYTQPEALGIARDIKFGGQNVTWLPFIDENIDENNTGNHGFKLCYDDSVVMTFGGYHSEGEVLEAIENLKSETSSAEIKFENPDDDFAKNQKENDTTEHENKVGS